jgi:hypothetical protein
MIYEISMNSNSVKEENSFIRAEVLLCAYLIIPSGEDVHIILTNSCIEVQIEYLLSV